jgi:glycosyltransferase involved in cell wall biosynthesis
MKISITIPAHNEEKRIEKTLETYLHFFRDKKILKEIDDFEILVVLNACRDNTLGVVEALQPRYPELRRLILEPAGKGFAIKTGFRDALTRDTDLIGFVDADMATLPETFFELVQAVAASDGVIASRWLPQSIVKTPQTFLRRVLSRGFNLLVKTILFLPYRDTQCGAKLFKRHTLEQIIDLMGNAQWAFDIELLYLINLRGLQMKELPTLWEDRKESKLSLAKVPLQMFLSLVRIRILYSPFKGLVTLYDKLPKWLKIHKV